MAAANVRERVRVWGRVEHPWRDPSVRDMNALTGRDMHAWPDRASPFPSDLKQKAS